MRKSSFTLALGLMLAAWAFPESSLAETAQASPPVGIDGTWTGTLSASGMDLRVVFHITETDAGRTATIDSPDQGAMGIPVSRVDWSKGTLNLEIARIGGAYSGSLSADGSRLQGTWTQGVATLPLDLKRGAAVAIPARPQTPKKPYPYAEKMLTFPSLAPGVTLAGTLTLPKTPGPFPAVILVSGSGPNGRDEVVVGHRIFLVLSDYLTRRGIAVLRYDKRGIGKSTGSYPTATTADFADDAEGAFHYLRSRPEINSKHVGIVGHSEGAIIAPIVAARCKDVAFIVLLGAPGMPGDQILIEQLAAIGKADGESAEKLVRVSADTRQIYALVKAEADPVALETRLKALMERQVQAEGPASGGIAAREKSIKALTAPWFRYFVRYDPKPALEKTTCPVLVISGALDLQVPPAENLPVIAAALKAAGNSDFTIKELPGLNHLLQEAKTGSPREYGKIEQTTSPVALGVIGDWIAAHSPVASR